MATAKIEREAASRGEGPLGKAADDEPVFILRAKDVFAYGAVKHWLDVAEKSNRVNTNKLKEAAQLLQSMLDWQVNNGFKYPD